MAGARVMSYERGKTSSRPSAASGLYMAVVSRLDGEDVYITIPRLTSSLEYGPILYVGSVPAVGNRLLVGFVEGRVDEIAGFTNPAALPVFSQGGMLTVKVGSHRLYLPFSCVINGVQASVGTAPVGGGVVVDLNVDGVTVFPVQGDRPTILSGEYVSGLMVPAVTAVSAGSFLTVDTDQIGSSVAGSDLTVVVWVTT